MTYEIVSLNLAYLNPLLEECHLPPNLGDSYFSLGSASCCLLENGSPVFAGGIVNLQWNRGEAWLLPTAFFKSHVKLCLKSLKSFLPLLAANSHFRRVQATCVKGVSARILMSLGFEFEGTLKHFGPHGELCDMYSRIFEEPTE